jgi:hypothetical protein
VAAVAFAVPYLALARSLSTSSSWNGTWTEDVSGDPSGHIYLIEKPGQSTVTGHYTFCGGAIKGTADGNLLSGTWTQKWPCGNARQGSGSFVFRRNPQGSTFAGTWGYGSSTTDTKPVPDGWSGTLQGLEVAGSPVVPEGAWSGEWAETISGGSFAPLYLIQRAGSASVVGSYAFCNGVITGTDNGGVLTGTWKQSFPCGGSKAPSGHVSFTLNSEGNAFSGTWGNGTSTTNSAPSTDTWTGKRASR